MEPCQVRRVGYRDWGGWGTWGFVLFNLGIGFERRVWGAGGRELGGARQARRLRSPATSAESWRHTANGVEGRVIGGNVGGFDGVPNKGASHQS